MKSKYFSLAAILVAIPLFVNANYTVDCEAFNTQSSAEVYGQCTNGKFKGKDDETGNLVTGECEDYGELDAKDAVTGEYVYGECAGQKE